MDYEQRNILLKQTRNRDKERSALLNMSSQLLREKEELTDALSDAQDEILKKDSVIKMQAERIAMLEAQLEAYRTAPSTYKITGDYIANQTNYNAIPTHAASGF